jgi:hypothetical protein
MTTPDAESFAPSTPGSASLESIGVLTMPEGVVTVRDLLALRAE